MTNVNHSLHNPIQFERPSEKSESLNEINKSGPLTLAAAVVSVIKFGPEYTVLGALLNRTANVLTCGRVPYSLPMIIGTTAATYFSPAILQASMTATELAAAGAVAGYQMASTAVQFVVNNPDKVAQFATDTLKTTMPHLAVPALLFTAVALSRPKNTI